jgi:CRISPR-associated endonuclease Csn1
VRILGIDGGIASTGWAVIEVQDEKVGAVAPLGKIIALGSRTFNSPEEKTQSGPKLKSADRRLHRGQRRVISRRRQRMNAIRILFQVHGLLASSDKTALSNPTLDPWALRASGLDRLLGPHEFAVALGHIARHRGFRSNAKRDRGANAAPDSSKMLSAIDATRERLSRWRTVGEMFACDPDYKNRRRNSPGEFTRSILRADHEREVCELFRFQRQHGSLVASDELETRYSDIAFSQRPLQSSQHMVGKCPFEPDEKRAARHCPSFELFRFLTRITSLRLLAGRIERVLTSDEISLAASIFGKTKGITFNALRKRLELDPNTRFVGLSADEEKKRDVVARLGGAADGTAALREVISAAVGEIEWHGLVARGGVLDQAVASITFREEPSEIRLGIIEAGLSGVVCDALMAGLETGVFSKFKGAGHISAKAARAMIPGLLRGLNYYEAAAEAGYDHTAKPITNIDDIGSPVARKALHEMLKQINAVYQKHGPFDRIHVEMARDVGKSIEERGKIERGIKDRTAEKDRARNDLKQLLKTERISAEDILRYELWKEQAGKSLYSDTPIPIEAVLATDNRIQVDHILPWSRFGDDSFINKTLCLAGENQDKAGRSPLEWFSADKSERDWDKFVARVEASTIRGRKKRNFLITDAKEVEEKFRTRNLNDTRYATRVLLAELKRIYPAEPGRERVFARPGELTSKLRRAWGLNGLKKSPTGERLSDDRHHALDALVVAAITERQLQRLTLAFQEAERRGLARDFAGLPEPWVGFREEVRRARGKAHDATIKQIREVDGVRAVFERKTIEKLTEADLERIPTPEPYGRIVDPMKLHYETVEALRTWIIAGKPKAVDQLPRSPKGDVIRKVRVRTTAKVAIEIRGGTADRGDMVRIDVFRQINAKGIARFFVVPVYPHQVAEDTTPPNKVVQSGGIEKWSEIDESYKFLWSIYPMSLIQLTKNNGEFIVGYFRGLNTNTGALKISPINDSTSVQNGIGVRTLLEFKKISIDRIGNLSEVSHEVRTWRGKAYT